VRKFLILFLLAGLVVLTAAGIGFAQETDVMDEADAPVEFEEADFSYGLVNKLEANQLILDEFDYDTNQEVSVTYTISADTKLEGAANLSDIAVGDGAEVKYDTKEGQRIAKSIMVEKEFIEGEAATDEAVEDEGVVEEKEEAPQEEIKLQ